MVKKILCILLNYELYLLKMRLEYEYDYYDNIIIVEANKTYSGKNKILYFEKYKNLFLKYMDKIIYVCAYDLPLPIKISYTNTNLPTDEYRWFAEIKHREYIKDGLEKLDLNNDDLIYVCDIDEIIKIDLNIDISNYDLFKFNYYDYRYDISKKSTMQTFYGAYCVKYKFLNHYPIDYFRYYGSAFKITEKIIPYIYNNEDGLYKWYLECTNITNQKHYKQTQIINAGWHLSNMTGGFLEILSEKIKNFSHSEFCNQKQIVEENINDIYYLFCDYINKTNIFDYHTIIDDDIPEFIKNNINTYRFLLKKKE